MMPLSRQRAKPLPETLRRVWIWTVALALLSAIYTVVMTPLMHSPHPYGLNMIYGTDRWWDFLIFRDRFLLFGSSQFWSSPTYPFTYPAPVAILFGLLYKLPHPLVVYLVSCVLAAIAWAGWLARGLVGYGIRASAAYPFAFSLVALAWPLWFQLVTANIEGFVVVTLALGVFACLRGRWWLGAVLIGVAGAMKIYPLILLGLLLSARRYREFAVAIVVAVAITLISLAVLGPSVGAAQAHITAGLAFVKDVFVFSTAPRDSICNHSLFVPIKQLIARLHHQTSATPATMWSYLDEPAHNHRLLQLPYTIYCTCAAAFGVIAYFARIRRMPMLNQVIALMVCAVLLPPISLDYTFSNLLLPFGLLCLYVAATNSEASAVRPSWLLFAAFVLVLTIGTFFTVKYRLAGAARTVLLVGLLFAAMRQPLPWQQLDRTAPEVSA